MYLIRFSKILIVLALTFSVWTGYKIWTTPLVYKSTEISFSASGDVIEREIDKHERFSDVSDLGVVPLLIPILIAFFAVWAVFKLKSIALVSSVFLMLFFCLIASFSIGMAYLPVAALLILTAIVNLMGRWQLHKANV